MPMNAPNSNSKNGPPHSSQPATPSALEPAAHLFVTRAILDHHAYPRAHVFGNWRGGLGNRFILAGDTAQLAHQGLRAGLLLRVIQRNIFGHSEPGKHQTDQDHNELFHALRLGHRLKAPPSAIRITPKYNRSIIGL